MRARADTATARSNAVGGRAVWGTVNSGEVLLKTVMFDRPERKHKLLIGWNQKVSGQVQGLQRSSVADDAPPVDRHNLTPNDRSDERSNPVVLPASSKDVGTAARKSGLRNSGKGMREEANAGR